MVNWSQYLESLCTTYAQWWQIYTITDVVGRKREKAEPSPLLFDFGLMVQTIERDREERGERQEKIERLGVLEGLQKYASEHVLLVGRPGSGKSTALVRLVLEEAQKANLTPQPPSLAGKGEQDFSLMDSPLLAGEGQGERSTKGHGNEPKIPVLVELRYYRTSILDLIQDFLQRHDANLTVDAETLKTWLRQGQLLLLLDGLNELPSEEARGDLQKFRQDFQKTTPMIFTTRDLGVGGDLEIAKKLEMQPLNEAQMQQFVRAYLPQQGEQMLRQLGSRLREFGQTPLLLWMLCSLFGAMGKVPPNLGLVFRQFAQSYYAKLKQDVPVTEESRDWCQLLLEQLAFRMTQGREKTELQVAIFKQEAEEILTAFLRDEGLEQPRNRALKWLKDLLKHHLIQLGAGDQIEFRHQLIQEYYTAEYLLKCLTSPRKTSPPTPLLQGEGSKIVAPFCGREGGLGLSDNELKREYLSYPKWIEPLALMLELLEDERQAVRVVRLALDVNLRLGARFAGAVKREFQEKAVGLIVGRKAPQALKTRLLGITGSDYAIPFLSHDLNHSDPSIRKRAIYALAQISSEVATTELGKSLNHSDPQVRRASVYALARISSEVAATELSKTLNHPDPEVRTAATSVIEQLYGEGAMVDLLEALANGSTFVRWKAASELGRNPSQKAITELRQALADEATIVREAAASALGQIGGEVAIVILSQALTHEDSAVRWVAVEALSQINNQAAIEAVRPALADKDPLIRWWAASTLGQSYNQEDIVDLRQSLADEATIVRETAASALARIGSETAVALLSQALNHENPSVRLAAIEALSQIHTEAAAIALRPALKDQDPNVRLMAGCALRQITVELRIKYNTIESHKYFDDSLYLQGMYDGMHVVRANQSDLASLTPAAKAAQAIRDWRHNMQIRQQQRQSRFFSSELSTSIPLMYILHLSDLHFGTLEQANLWFNQLAADLYNDLSISHLDALILSGDIANYSTEEEYIAAQQFLHNLCQDFPLNPEQIILVPGNHDLNWKLAKKAYKLIDRDEYDGQLIDGHYIEESASVIRVRDEAKYKQRFAHFSQFYETIKQKPYPLDYDQQFTLDHLPEQDLLILGLNSAWQLDHHYKTRASIHMGALTNALTQIRRNPDYKNSLKIAVWHHPLDSASSDRITDQGFLEQLAVNGFRFFLHGHIHKAETSLYRYDMSTNGRKLDRICAGTFGAPVREWVPGYPLQYNLLKIADNQLTVYTRRREELNGAWKPDARWLQGAGKTPLDYYAINLS